MKPSKLWEGLDSNVFQRLCECKSLKKDILPLAKCIYKNKNMDDKEQALIYVLEHLSCNSQFFDLTREEWDDIVSNI